MSTDPEPPAERDESRLPTTSDSDSDSSDSDAAPKQSTEWLATTRGKRSTAGNRMKSMLANEEPDSDMELLFAEDEDDQGFSDAGADASDVHMDSSSDDEDENNAAADDLEGEKELERQVRERRAAQRKRKAQDAIPAKFRKRVRIDPTPAATTAPAARPKKKSERTSWLPSAADKPTRASSRQTTRLSKEQLHAQMEEREARRLKQLEHMQKKAAKMEALRKPPMTQEERLREAALVEKRNSKSLNRWEEAEKQREEERRAKLAALSQRTLKGPVITFWSGTREWKDGGAARYVVMEEKPKRREKKIKDKDKDKAAAASGKKGGKDDQKAATTPSGDPSAAKPESQAGPSDDASQEEVEQTKARAASGGDAEDGPQTLSTPQAAGESTGESTETPVSKPKEGAPLMAMPPMPPPPASGLAAPAPPQDTTATSMDASGPPDPKPSRVLAAPVLAPPAGIDVERTSTPTHNNPLDPPKSDVLAPPNTTQPPNALSTPNLETTTEPVLREACHQPVQNAASPADKPASATPSEAPEPPPPASTTATRNTIVYQNFDENAIKDKTVQTQILFGRKMNKIAKPPSQPLCVITNHPARYRDPGTGLPFYNAYAYREIQRLQRREYHWSRLLGAWAGSGTYAAKGVPERFLRPTIKEKKEAEKEGEQKAEEENKGDGVKAEVKS